jgi:hypothetical protein
MDGQMNNTVPNMTPEEKGGGAGSMIATVVVVVIIIIGAIYFWNARSVEAPAVDDTASVVEGITNVSTSDETADIEADLNSTELDELNAELNAI